MGKRLAQAALLLTGLLALTVAQAGASTPAAELQSRLAGMEAYRADFKQQTWDDTGALMQSVEGELTVARPGKLHWQTASPYNQLMISNGDRLWHYDRDLNQVTVQAFSGQLSRTPAVLLSGEVDRLQDNFTVTRPEDVDGTVFRLEPNGNSELFRSMRVAFRDGRVVAIDMVDSLQQRTRIEFSNIRLNPDVEPSLFEFEPPEGVDVLRND